MKYMILAPLLPSTLYAFGFSKYNWKKGNKIGACGVIFVSLTHITLTLLYLFVW